MEYNKNYSVGYMDYYMNEVYLSICIPTYNRYKYLEQTINSIITQECFLLSNEIEIVICDNNSTDKTFELAEQLINLHGSKIIYHKNEVNIFDRNFEKSLSLGSGKYLKLNNDTLIHSENSLSLMLDTIKKHDENEILFFSGGNLNKNKIIKLNGTNEFVSNVSFWITWIGFFGIWKNHFKKIQNFSKYHYTQLIQVDVIFGLIRMYNNISIDDSKITTSIVPRSKGGFDVLTIFLDNYSFFLKREYLENGLTKKVLNLEKEIITEKLIFPWIRKTLIFNEFYSFKYNLFFLKLFLHFFYNPIFIFKIYFKYLNIYAVNNFYYRKYLLYHKQYKKNNLNILSFHFFKYVFLKLYKKILS